MNITYSVAQLEQFRRNAKRLARQQGIPHNEALDQIAREHGFKNWSLLSKQSRKTSSTTKCDDPVPPIQAPPTDAVEVNPTVGYEAEEADVEKILDGRKRHYFHGDQIEGDSDRYFCAICDRFVFAEHFSEKHTTELNHEKCLRQKERWPERSTESKARHRRPVDAVNMLERPALAAREAFENSRSPFTRWLEQQTRRNDPIGDFANDALRDGTFPKSAHGCAELERYLNHRRAYHVIEILRNAWAEFVGTKLKA